MSSCKFDFKLSSMFDVTSSIPIRHRHLVIIAASSSSYCRKCLSAKGRITKHAGFYSASELSLPDSRANDPVAMSPLLTSSKKFFKKAKS
jgi:hypothetical protein